MAKETNEVLGHSDDADGIEEYDNPLPDWWVGMFVMSIVWAAAYGISYHFILHDSQEKQYDAVMADAAERWPAATGAVAFAMDETLVAEGASIFAQTCASCHGAELTGGIGANLVDAIWIHGGQPDDIINTITHGVPEMSMPAWGPILGPAKVQAVAAFVVSKQTLAPIHVPRVAATDTPSVAGEPVVADGVADGVADATDPGTPEAHDEEAEELIEVDDPIAAGAEVFATNCVACHGADMTGGVGPNLIDNEWIHGGDLDTIRTVITNGVPEKGMISWGPILGAQKIEWVAQYVHSKSAN